ncbi:MAG: dihydrofolate reductase, partial [Muribaculaceae bacterium]|nr:dihydrofolate reductase [Muribaculaceae bacterium]
MSIIKRIMPVTMLAAALTSCSNKEEAQANDFNYVVDNFADIQVLRYQVPGFENLSLEQKKLIYYLTEAAISGRDILWDQNCAYNLPIRQVLEGIYTNYAGDKESADYKAFEKYLKQVEFANGIHHHYSMDKFTPEFSQEFFIEAVKSLPTEQLPLAEGQDTDAFIAEITPVIFDPTVLAKRVNQAEGADLITTSACNLYGGGITQAEVEQYYNKLKDPKDQTPISYGLNSRLIKRDGKIEEEVYRVGGLYSPAIERIV